MKSKKTKVINAGIGYTFSNLLVKGISFLSIPIFTRLLSTEDYGVFSVYLAYESILALVFGFGIHASLKAAYLKWKEEIDSYVSLFLLIQLLIVPILLIIVFVFNNFLSRFSKLPLLAIYMMIGHAFSTSVIQIYNKRISLDFRYKKYILLSIINAVGSVALSIIFILLLEGNQKSIGRILGSSIILILSSSILIFSSFKKGKPIYNRGFLDFGLKYGLPLVSHGFAQVIILQFGIVYIQNIIGFSEAGIYGLALSIASIPMIIGASIDTAWGPWFFKKLDNKFYKEIQVKSILLISTFGVVMILGAAFAGEILSIFLPTNYHEVINLIVPALLCAFFSFLYIFPAQIEYFYGKTKLIAFNTIITSIINILLIILIVPRFGYKTAVYITLLTYFINFCIHYYTGSKIAINYPFKTTNIVILIIWVVSTYGIFMIFRDQIFIRLGFLILSIGIGYILNYKNIKSFRTSSYES